MHYYVTDNRLYDWVSNPKKDVKELIKMQGKNTQLEFQDRAKLVITQLAEQSMNAAIFFENPDARSYVSMVPTSAATGILSIHYHFLDNIDVPTFLIIIKNNY